MANKKLENWIEDFTKQMSYFCKKINWGASFLDADAIQFMNSGFGIVELKKIIADEEEDN